MSVIIVKQLSSDTKADPLKFQVEISDEKSKTSHSVTVSQETYQRLAGGLKSAEELVKASFEFLLERESKESILKSFDLTEIQKYFPEYEKLIHLSQK
jgi:hypothetical protein